MYSFFLFSLYAHTSLPLPSAIPVFIFQFTALLPLSSLLLDQLQVWKWQELLSVSLRGSLTQGLEQGRETDWIKSISLSLLCWMGWQNQMKLTRNLVNVKWAARLADRAEQQGRWESAKRVFLEGFMGYISNVWIGWLSQWLWSCLCICNGEWRKNFFHLLREVSTGGNWIKFHRRLLFAALSPNLNSPPPLALS